ncbi:MAG: bifunctional phosphoribosylaminoimidazolecarboxamide formyltransferase/IMP cyclohydrolase PurH [Actinobacteria bacterium]|nr:bifunctional phosphoribosylaminoimidazolecarboxamide formyltransferase/IMP cyclohydrolase PurH [Actinomycetota bacterium]NBY15326.1 bifunctional phosphoribosylaminoimidazolecarboxamide formyltransferase/IMP cyclohydrolase PurH [Actinomycetota bacterium]
MSDTRKIKRALISVYDKTGLAELAQGLYQSGVAIVSTGSTAATISGLGIPVTQVQEVTGFAECLDGRVKTLHPNIHAGLLADLRDPSHQEQLTDLNIAAFELVVVNLYPFNQTVASGASIEECIEQIDIGGPAMVRGSAKNHANVAIVVDPANYSKVLSAAKADGFTHAQRLELAAQAFRHVASYDVAVASWLSELSDSASGFPAWVGSIYEQTASLRYGENPHQKAALYSSTTGPAGIAQSEQLHGKEMSYNNYVDADAARRAVYDFLEPAVAIIKHANPCGLAIGSDIAQAYQRAHATDPTSAFGGVIATNRPVTKAMAESVVEIFTEVICAPDFDQEALVILQTKPNLRLLKTAPVTQSEAIETRPISGGLLRQTKDVFQADGDNPENWQLVAGPAAQANILSDLVFAWHAVRCVKSNAILLASSGAAVGIGMGQVNRVDSARLAVSRAAERVVGSVAASDAFFPFADGLQVLLEAGVKAVVAPGGSVRDEEVIAAANSAGITMYFTGTRHFFH